jgi:NitT/TauT family transport system substrate-binding protein
MKRAAAIGGIAALAASFNARVAGAQAAAKIRLTTTPIDEGAQAYYAAELGLFAKHGLDVEVLSFTNGNDAISAIVGNAVEIGNSNIMTVASAHARKLPIQLLGEAGVYSSLAPTAYILVTKTSLLQTASDLNGKTVAINGLGGITQVAVQSWVDGNGGDSKSLKFVDVPFAVEEAVLVAGHADAAILPEPLATFELSKGQTRILCAPDDAIAKRFAIGGWVVKTDWLANNPTTVRAFNEAMREAARWGNDPKNRQQSAAILLKYTKIEVGAANRVVYGEHLVAADIQPQIDVAAKYGILASAFPAADMFVPPPFRG